MAQDAAEGKNVVIFGANTVQQCLGAGLIDEIVIHPVPVLLSDDVRLYGAPGAERVDLKRIAALKSGQVVDLRFEVRK